MLPQQLPEIMSETITYTTDGSGAATVYSSRTLRGEVVAITWSPTAHDSTADCTITAETHFTPLATITNSNSSQFYIPHASSGRLYTGSYSSSPVAKGTMLLEERVKVVIAQAGATKSGTVKVWYRPL